MTMKCRLLWQIKHQVTLHGAEFTCLFSTHIIVNEKQQFWVVLQSEKLSVTNDNNNIVIKYNISLGS